MQYFRYYFKQSLIVFVYLISTMLIAFAIAAINPQMMFLKILLSVVNIAMCMGVSGMYFFVMGKKAMKQSKINNEEREEMLRTGRIRKLETVKEYRPYRGFTIGLAVCLPMFILLIIQIFLDSFGASNGVIGLLLTVLYGTFYLPVKIISTAAVNYFVLYGALIITLEAGLVYLYGARFEAKLQQKVEDLDAEIYGDKKIENNRRKK